MPLPWRDPSSGIYYANFRVPTELVPVVGKKHILKSLRTKERSIAERKNCELWLQHQRQFDELRRKQALNAPLVEEYIPHLVEDWLHSTLRDDESDRQRKLVAGLAPRTDDDEETNGGYSVLIDQLEDGYDSGKHPDFLLREAAWFLNEKAVPHDTR